MAKANLDGVPETGSKWVLDGMEGVTVTVGGFRKKGNGGYVKWNSESSVGNKEMKFSEWKKKAKAA